MPLRVLFSGFSLKHYILFVRAFFQDELTLALKAPLKKFSVDVPNISVDVVKKYLTFSEGVDSLRGEEFPIKNSTNA